MADTRNGGGTAKTKDKAPRVNRRRKQVVKAATTGAAIGIGSAALVAALLYANRAKDEKEAPAPSDPRFEPGEA